MQLIDRLEELHKIGFLHRDIKPENILIGSNNFKSDESSVINLIDFGVSTPFYD